jgi:hypothetical protein
MWRQLGRVGGKVAVCAGNPVVLGIIRNLKLFRPEIVTQFHRARTASETLRHSGAVWLAYAGIYNEADFSCAMPDTTARALEGSKARPRLWDWGVSVEGHQNACSCGRFFNPQFRSSRPNG